MDSVTDLWRKVLPIALAALTIGLLVASGCTSTQGTSTPSATTTATSASTSPAELTVFAAASLKDAFTELKGPVETSHPGVTVRFNFDGSQVLRTQLEKGATADVFASANTKQMSLAKAAGLMKNDSVRVFANNRLAVLVPKANPAGIAMFEDLGKSGVRLAIGTKDVPIGDYARQVFDRTVNNTSYGPDFRTRLLANVVTEETSVNALATKVVLGEVDAGIGYVSDVPVAQKAQVILIEIPSDLNVIAEYPIGVLQGSTHPELAQAFSELVRSAEGKAVLDRDGFATV